MVRTSRISRSGQLTLPRTVRAALGTDRVRIILENGQVRIEPSPDPGGSLQRYARKPRILFKSAIRPGKRSSMTKRLHVETSVDIS